MMKESLNIYMVVWKFFPCAEGGAERQCRKLAAELSEQGYSCQILTSYLYTDLQLAEEMPEGYGVLRFGTFSWIEEAFKKRFRAFRKKVPWIKSGRTGDAVEFWAALPFVWLSRLSFMLALKKFFKKNNKKIEIIHVHEAHWIAGAVAWASQGLGLPVVCKEADCPAVSKMSYDTPLRRNLAWHRQQVDFIAMTKAISESLQESGIGAERITRIPNGVDVPPESSRISGRRDIVYIGNFTQGAKRKAFDILFEAWVLIQERDKGRSRLVMLGAGDPAVWEKYLNRHACLDTVYFAGAVKDVASYLKNARLFLLPSRVEGLSNALLEAMSWGLPVIVSDIPANCSLVEHRVNGWVVPVNDSSSLAAAVLTLLNDEALSLQLGHAARERIKEQYTIRHIARRLIELYKGFILKNREMKNDPTS